MLTSECQVIKRSQIGGRGQAVEAILHLRRRGGLGVRGWEMRMGLSLDFVRDDGGKVDVDIGDSANVGEVWRKCMVHRRSRNAEKSSGTELKR